MSSPTKRVAIVGAGISGVVTAAHLKREGHEVTVFERSAAAGGIWLYDERKPLEPAYPSIAASKAGNSYWKGSIRHNAELDRLIHAPPGPCYVGLKNNVSTRLLETTLNQFPAGTEESVTHDVLQAYIQDTAIVTGVNDITKYNTEVKNLTKIGSNWEVETVALHPDGSGEISRKSSVSTFDSVVVASGHYHAPRIPDISGLANWKRRWPDRVEHSKGYRRPEDYQGKNFLIIGGSVSATDIARELSPLANNIYQSHRNGAFDLPAALLPENGIRVDEVVSFDVPTDSESTTPLSALDPIPGTAVLKSGQRICDIHHVILATGYHITLPFLPHLHADEVPADQADDTILVTDGTQFHNLHKDIFYIKDPSLIFVGIPYFTATFTLFEFQAMAVSQVLSGRAKLPNKEAMQKEYRERVRAKGTGKSFHSLRNKEVEYVNELLEWVNKDLEGLGRKRIEGHSEKWHAALAAQVERMKVLFNPDLSGPTRTLEASCA